MTPPAVSRADRLTRRVTLQHLPSGVDAAGQPNGTWTAYREVYAEIYEDVGREALRGGQVEHGGGLTIEIIHPRGKARFPTVEDRVTWVEGDTGTTRTVHIEHIKRSGHDRRRLFLICTEVG